MEAHEEEGNIGDDDAGGFEERKEVSFLGYKMRGCFVRRRKKF